MFRLKMNLVGILLLVVVTLTTALEPADKFIEGSCIAVQPVKASRVFIDSLKRFSGGSRGLMFQFASSMPNYDSMREDEFYYEACFSRNTSTVNANRESNTAAIFGFVRMVFPFSYTIRPGVYLRGSPNGQSWNTVTDTVTLTDNKSFAVIVQCWEVLNRRNWAVVSRTGILDTRTEQIIQDHVTSLGFKAENTVFMRHDSCRLGFGNPDL